MVIIELVYTSDSEVFSFHNKWNGLDHVIVQSRCIDFALMGIMSGADSETDKYCSFFDIADNLVPVVRRETIYIAFFYSFEIEEILVAVYYRTTQFSLAQETTNKHNPPPLTLLE